MVNPYDKWSSTLKSFHDHFRHAIGDLARSLGVSTSKELTMPPVLDLQQLKALHRTILELMGSLTMHHTIEDHRLFPFLSKKIPEFKELGEEHHQLEAIIAQLTALARIPIGQVKDLSSHVGKLHGGVAQLQLLVLPHMAAEEELTTPAKTRLLFTEQEMRSLFG